MNSEPVAISVAIGGLLTTGVALLAILWPQRLTPEMQVGIIGFGNAVILTVTTIIARRNVWKRESVERIQAAAAATGETPPLDAPP